MQETDSHDPPSRSKVSRKALLALVVVAVVILALDRVSKWWVVNNLTLGEPVNVIGELLRFHYVENPGAAFSIGSGSTWIFAILATAVTVFIVVFARRIRSLGWAVLFGLLLGGNLGNLTDRLTRAPGFGRGYVVDFIQVWGFPAIFNIADIAIVSSMGLFIILTLRGIGIDAKRTIREPKVPSASPDAS